VPIWLLVIVFICVPLAELYLILQVAEWLGGGVQGAALTIALLLPITFKVEPTSAFILFAGIYYGAMYGGSTTSILLNTPGESATIVTALEGNKMARNGRAGAALAVSDGPPLVRSENARLAGWIYVDIRDRDLGGYVHEAFGWRAVFFVLAGLGALLESTQLAERAKQPYWPQTRFVLAGFLPDGRQIRISWFEDYRLEHC